MSGKYIVGRNTKIYVAPLLNCDRVKPEPTTFTVATIAPAALAESITITMTPAITRAIPASAAYPVFINFVEASGRDHLVEVVADIDPGDTTLTVKPLKRDIAIGAIASFPLLLANRSSANLTANDNAVDVMTFENQGYKMLPRAVVMQ